MLPVWKVTILRWSCFKSFEHIDISWKLASKNSGERKLEEARRQINSANRSALDAWLGKDWIDQYKKGLGGLQLENNVVPHGTFLLWHIDMFWVAMMSKDFLTE